MKKTIFYAISLLILSACGPSEAEVQQAKETEIRKEKEKLDKQFDEIMDTFYLGNENLENHSAYGTIKSKLKSSDSEIAEYAQIYVDSVAALKTYLHDLKFGSLFEYAKKEGWDKLANKDFENVESSLKVKGDEFSNSVVYRHPSSPKFINYNGFFLYYTKSNENSKEATLFLRTQYRADDWLFCESAKVSIDGDVYTTNFIDWERDNDGGYIFEWSTEKNPSFNLLIKILNSKTAKIRFNGDKYYDDRSITNEQKNALKQVVKSYYGLYVKK